MKKTKKHNIKNISFLALTFSALCLAGCNAVESSNSNVVEQMPQAYVMQKNAIMPRRAYGDSLVVPTNYLTDKAGVDAAMSRAGVDLSDTSAWPTSFSDSIVEHYTADVVITSGTSTINTLTGADFTIQRYKANSMGGAPVYGFYINQQISQTSGNNTGIAYVQDTSYSSGGYTFTISNYDDDLYYVITGQEAPVAEPSMGEQIVDGIESGLGMIGTLASEFLAGFGALFYVNNQLTPFAIFSLVFLGIAITFAIIKLCLNVVRSNTGA